MHASALFCPTRGLNLPMVQSMQLEASTRAVAALHVPAGLRTHTTAQRLKSAAMREVVESDRTRGLEAISE